MPVDAPDGTLWFQSVDVVGSDPVPGQNTTETPVSEILKVTNSDQTYQDLVAYDVPTDKVAYIYGLELYSDDFAHTLFRLEIDGTEKWTDLELPVATNMQFVSVRLGAGVNINLQGKSSDGTEVNMWGAIEGKEVG